MSDSTPSVSISRRDFVRVGTGSGLALWFGIGSAGEIVSGLAERGLAPNQWIVIDDHGRITIKAHKSEMGQGVRTSLPAIVAAELGADWSRVSVAHAEPGPDFPEMGTSGSNSIGGSWRTLRTAAATARALLVTAAANRWHVAPDTCDARGGFVVERAGKRRLAFGALVADAARLPVPKTAPLRPDTELSLIGSRLKRVDTHDIVRGAARYGIDVRIPNMRVAVIARAPRRGAALTRADEAAARAVAGVEHVVRISNGIAIVARNTWSAMQGRTALAAQWNMPDLPRENSAEYLARLEQALSSGKVARREGDAAGAIARAARRIEALYRAPFQAHAAMEPLSCVADVHADRCEIWTGTQRPNGVRARAAAMLGIPENRVTVHVTLIGGAFGRRIAIDYAEEAIELSRALGGPVQVVWSREDDLEHDMYQSAQVNRLTAGLDASGAVVGWRHEVGDFNLSMFGAYNSNFNPADDGDPWGGFDSPYAFPAFDCTLALLEAPVPTGAWRSVTYPAAVFARESFLDEVAHTIGRDPLTLRLSLIPSPGNIQRRAGPRPNGDRLRNVLQLAAARAGKVGALAPANGRRRGRGIACNPYSGEAMVAQVADVSVGDTGDIRVERVVTAIDVGRVIDRSGLEAQVEGGVAWALSAALKTEATFENGVVRQHNFNDFPVLRLREMPAQEIIVVDSVLGPFGAGEAPVPAVGAAVANAVFAATGQRLRQTPLRVAT